MKNFEIISLIDSIESTHGQIILKEIVSLLQDKEHSLIKAIKSKPVAEGFTEEAKNVLNYTRGQIEALETLITKTLNPNLLKQSLEIENTPPSY